MQNGGNGSLADGVAIGIAAAALLFTIGSFWWINVRRGRLRLVGQPRSFALSTMGGLHLTIPLALYNSGPTPVWALNLQLRFSGAGLPAEVPFVATRPGVNPRAGDDRPLATQVVLAGRESRVICCEFIAHPFSASLAAGDVTALVRAFEARSWGKSQWRDLGSFPLRITADVVQKQGQYIAHDNYPGVGA
jgi:hypothetical protein